MADLGTQVLTLSSGSHTKEATLRLSRSAQPTSADRIAESEPLLPSTSHQTHYVPLLTTEANDSHTTGQTARTNHSLIIDDTTIEISMTGPSISTTTATLRPTVTTTITDSMQSSSSSISGSSSSSAKDHRNGLIQIPIPDKFMRKGDKLMANKEANSLWRSFLALLFVFANMTLNLTVLAIIHERVPRNQPPLPDLAFDILPTADWALSVAEYIIVIQVVGVVVLITLHRYRVILFRRICIILGVLYLFRAICMASTQVPVANVNYYCSPQLRNSSDPSGQSNVTTGQFISIIASRVFYMSLGMGLSINGHHSYCGDYIYSGHTIILTIAYLMFREYAIPSRCRTYLWKFVNFFLIALTLTGIVCILISRGHYLIDIVIAYFATTRVFWIYHTLCYNNALRFQPSTNYLSRVWWYHIFIYFESAHPLSERITYGDRTDSQLSQMTPRSFEWPLPWPRFLRRKRRSAQRLLQTQQA
ncbi:phosphatidylcholine:ceramide cholinephosphotransferase 2-like [Oppia nitens]|uniref:phosphatidylcholine:ceramide cholinephosphotransferase 2-like n=1 Tax=Oppia nitens TaxID=1686743 RepID=UPI0023DAF34E|nr:phosphatidylcholine:ceramide cholinephosphotransferase 2-like [Oppia nitens]XP_054166765.1 phosphatidylcholine:ceramide cholinephosphotransferase 2-like [Oppia nitens]